MRELRSLGYAIIILGIAVLTSSLLIELEWGFFRRTITCSLVIFVTMRICVHYERNFKDKKS